MTKSYIKQLYAYLTQYKASVIKCIFTSIAINTVSVLLLFQFKIIFDRFVPEHDIASIYKISLFLLLMIFTNFILQRIYQANVNRITACTQYAIRQDVFTHIHKTKYEFFSRKNFGEVNTNIIQDVESLSNSIFQRLVNSLSQILYCIATFSILLYINMYLALIVFGFLMVFSVLIIKLKNTMEKYSDDYAAARTNLNTVISDLVDGVKVISLYHVETNFMSKLEEANKKANNKWLKTNIFSPCIQSSIEIATLITYLMTFIVGSKLISNHSMTMGGLLLYVSYLPQIWSRYGAVVDIFSGLLSAKVYAKRILNSLSMELYEEDNCGFDESENTTRTEQSSITIKDIDFSYNKHNIIYKNFSANFNKPGIYCIVGESGCGKSTLFELLLRFYKVTKGEIYINNISVYNYPLNKLRKLIGIVHQEPYIVNDTVIGNIKFGDDTISDNKIRYLSKSLGFDKYLCNMENSYYTKISCKSNNITSGQKRIISILRVLVREPEFLLFDEITANMDSFTETLIHSFLREISKKKICLFVTHKYSDTLLTDNILQLN